MSFEDAPTLVRGDNEPVLPVDVSIVASGAERYARGEVLGHGGMGVVTLVEDRSIGRRVAMKELKALDRPQAVERFRREALLQAQLEHPAIVPVYDVGVAEDGQPFFTMKHVRGESLASILRAMLEGGAEVGATYSQRRLLSALSQVSAAVHYAHERGVVHRDIKPANIMLGRYGEVYLLDWGIARLDAEADADPVSGVPNLHGPSEMTTHGAVIGSPSTIAPEQARGETVDHRADVYSLGAVLFEILTLEPFHGPGGAVARLARAAAGVTARASARRPDRDVPVELDDLCAAATTFRVEERLDSALALHQALERYLDGERDVEARRRAARDLSRRAAELAEPLLQTVDAKAPIMADEIERRGSAVGAAARALALDPAEDEAFRTLVALMTTPPRALPEALRRENLDYAALSNRRGAMAAIALYGAVLANAAFILSMGVRDWTVFTMVQVLYGAALALAVVSYFRPTSHWVGATVLTGLGATVYLTNFHSSIVLVPQLLSAHVVLCSLMRGWGKRWFYIGVAVVAWTVSAIGDQRGWFAARSLIGGDGIEFHSAALFHPMEVTRFYVYIGALMLIVAPAVAVGLLREHYGRTQDELRLLSWQLHHLFPRRGRRLD